MWVEARAASRFSAGVFSVCEPGIDFALAFAFALHFALAPAPPGAKLWLAQLSSDSRLWLGPADGEAPLVKANGAVLEFSPNKLPIASGVVFTVALAVISSFIFSLSV